MAFELDGLRLKVTVTGGTADDPLPTSFGWASAIASRGSVTVAGAATPTGTDVLCTWAADALAAGAWLVQVRAGATQGTARTIYSETITIEDSLRVTP